MNSSADSIEFKPPQSGRWLGPMGLAVIVHVLLIVALTWGVHWQKDNTPTFEAELWSPVAQKAAPRAVEPPPPPPPPPAPRPAPKPEPKPQPAPEPAPVKKDADIAVEQAKKLKEEQERQRLAQEKAKKEKAERERVEKEKRERERKLAEEKKKKEAEEQKKRLAEQKRKEEAAKRKLEEDRQQASQRIRDEQMRRILGQAGATGAPDSTGTAQRSSGPSSSYAGMVAARIRPNIIYTQDFPSRLATEVEVRAQPDGRITDRRVVRSSGNRDWDEAALRAIDRTGSLPRDVDGRVPSPIVIVVRPMD